MTIDRTARITFEETADLYNETRLGYPEALIEDVISLSGIPAGGRILEVGCGPGNATLPFARRGYRITAVELGPRLAEYARHNCRAYPDVEIITSSFEDWPLSSRYDLVMSAEAFHWIPPSIGYPKAAQALKPTGSAALFWDAPIDPDNACSHAVDRVYQQIAPDLPQPGKNWTAEWLVGQITQNFVNSGCFGVVNVRQYPWFTSLTTEKYLKLLRTFSSHRGMEEALRQRLYAAIGEVIDSFGGQIELPQLSVLFVAQRKD